MDAVVSSIKPRVTNHGDRLSTVEQQVLVVMEDVARFARATADFAESVRTIATRVRELENENRGLRHRIARIERERRETGE